MLYLISTPIGNLKDITLRALDILKDVDLILCEDTRHSKTLLDHYNIKNSLKSYHKFNEVKELEQILSFLKEGKKIALISDAGTPCIQDPGALLIKACQKEGIAYTAIPGPCALAMAFSLSALESGPFQFIGFFPKKTSELKQAILNCLDYEGHSFGYLSSHQLEDVLETLESMDPSREIILFKELTKLHESIICARASEIKGLLTKAQLKGEFILMIKKGESSQNFLSLPIDEHVKELEKTFNIPINEAIKVAAKQRGMSKRDLYKIIKGNRED